jgi:hypothetical protein
LAPLLFERAGSKPAATIFTEGAIRKEIFGKLKFEAEGPDAFHIYIIAYRFVGAHKRALIFSVQDLPRSPAVP